MVSLDRGRNNSTWATADACLEKNIVLNSPAQWFTNVMTLDKSTNGPETEDSSLIGNKTCLYKIVVRVSVSLQ